MANTLPSQWLSYLVTPLWEPVPRTLEFQPPLVWLSTWYETARTELQNMVRVC